MREEKLLNYLKGACTGRKYRASGAELEAALGISGTDLRKLVNRMRRKGIPIGSDRCGYFYKRLPAISGQALERVDIDFLCQELLGLRIDYARLSLNGEKIGLTSSCDIGVEVFPEDPSSTEEQYYMLDGKTILIESDLMKEGANIGRRNYTVSHESCHHILKMLFPHDYGAQASGRSIHCCYRSNRGNGDWEEWQVETLAAMILLPPECVVRSMERFGLGTQMRLLNRVFAPADYKKFEAIASFMGASKTALSIRMTQLGLLKRNDLFDPYSLVRVDMDEEDRML